MSALTRMDMAALRALWPEEHDKEFKRSAWFIARHAKVGLRQAYDWLLDIGLAKVPERVPDKKPWTLRRCAAYATTCVRNARDKGLRDGKLSALPPTAILSLDQWGEAEDGENMPPVQVSVQHADDVAWQAEAKVTHGVELVADQQGKGESSIYRAMSVQRAARDAGQAQLPLQGGEATGRCPRPPRQSTGRVRRDLKRQPDPNRNLFGDDAEGGDV